MSAVSLENRTICTTISSISENGSKKGFEVYNSHFSQTLPYDCCIMST